MLTQASLVKARGEHHFLLVCPVLLLVVKSGMCIVILHQEPVITMWLFKVIDHSASYGMINLHLPKEFHSLS